MPLLVADRVYRYCSDDFERDASFPAALPASVELRRGDRAHQNRSRKEASFDKGAGVGLKMVRG